MILNSEEEGIITGRATSKVESSLRGRGDRKKKKKKVDDFAVQWKG